MSYNVTHRSHANAMASNANPVNVRTYGHSPPVQVFFGGACEFSPFRSAIEANAHESVQSQKKALFGPSFTNKRSLTPSTSWCSPNRTSVGAKSPWEGASVEDMRHAYGRRRRWGESLHYGGTNGYYGHQVVPLRAIGLGTDLPSFLDVPSPPKLPRSSSDAGGPVLPLTEAALRAHTNMIGQADKLSRCGSAPTLPMKPGERFPSLPRVR
mmetsp:Transcript_99615/g.266123  ORF Transcript_99615/g.266123 Transcript_99615/m.266123 type:complete len:211 (+) Transcript_99615:44-676(+)